MRIPYLELLIFSLLGPSLVNATEREHELRDLATTNKNPSSRPTTKTPISFPTPKTQTSQPTTPPTRPNILLIISDDFRARDLDSVDSPVILPNLKALAAKGRSYTAMPTDPVCGPGRNALLTMVKHPQVVTFDQDYKQLGYNSIFEIIHKEDADFEIQDFGKVMHFDSSKLKLHTLFARNETSAPNPCVETGNNDCPNRQIGCKLPITQTTDYKVANYAINALKDFAKRAPNNPHRRFFYAIGFHNSHLKTASSFGVKYILPPVDTSVPKTDLSPYPYSLNHLQCDDMLVYKVGANKIVPSGKIGDVDKITANRKLTDAIRALYLNALAGVDREIGRVLDTLNTQYMPDGQPLAANTLVIFTADHGFSNGEQNEWCKRILTPEMKIPLIVYWPGVTDVAPGRSKAIVSASDISVTIMEIVLGKKTYTHPSGITTTGISFLSTLFDPLVPKVRDWVTSSVYRCQDPSQTAMNNPCTTDTVRGRCDRPKIKWAGHSAMGIIAGQECTYIGFWPYNEISTCDVNRYYGQPDALQDNVKSWQIDLFNSGTVFKRNGVAVKPIQQVLTCHNASALVGEDDNPNVRNLINSPAYAAFIKDAITHIQETQQIPGGKFPYPGPRASV